MAAYAIQFRRGTTTQHSSFTGLVGEVTVDTDKKTVVVHDGSTAGGTALALEGAAISTTTGAFSSNVTIAGTLTMSGHVLPSADVTYDLGSSSAQWRDIYVGPGSLYVNGTKVIEDDSGTINITTDNNEDLKLTTTGTGTLKFISANGINLTGQLGATSGDLQIGDHIDMNSSLIKELGTPVSGTDAANKTYVDTTSGTAVTGGANAGSFTTVTTTGNATIGGDLTVSGTTTSVNTTNVVFEDNMFVLNSNTTGSPTENSGFEVERGDSLNVQFLWNETDDRWSVGAQNFHSGANIAAATLTGDLTGNVTGALTGNSAGVHTGAVTGNLTGNSAGVHTGAVTGNLTGNSAGVHTGAVTGNVTGNASGSAGTVTSIAAHLLDEDNMASDSATKVASQQSIKKYVDDSILTKDNTDEITEGSTNLYYTDARARAAISATGSLAYNSTTGVISFTMNDETVEDIVGGMVTGNTETGITVTYQDGDGTLDFVVTSQTDENFTTADHAKLDGIEASADVTDATNVNAAGALMLSDTTTAGLGIAIDEDNMASDSATKFASQQSIKAYVDAVSTAFAAADSADATAWAAADAVVTAAHVAADTAQTTSINTAWAAGDAAVTTAMQTYADQAETDAVATAAADATAKVAVLTAGASASLDTLLEIANVMATDAELSSAIAALNHDSLSGFVANEHIDWTADQGGTNLHAGNYTDTNTTYSVGDGGLTQINFTSADNTKLDGIEASADVTDTANVTSSGALMDSELTGIAHVKSLNQALTTTSSPSFTAVTAATLNGTATYALYADLAERYAADATYEEGTVLAFGGEAEVTSAQGYGSTKIAGVVSLNPGFAMNSEAGNSETHPYIALQGRVPTKVMGTVSKGDVLVASEVSGIATVWTDSTTDPRMTAYVGIAIEDKTTDAVGFIEVKVGK